MQGRVFFRVRPGRHDGFAHPNAVVVELGVDAFLCVAGFTPGKDRYERAKAAEHRQGVWGSAFAVEVDHAKHLTPLDPRLELHVCGYVCQTAEVITAAQLQGAREWGSLSSAALRDIAEGLLAREAERPYLAKSVVTALKQLLGR